MQAIKALYREGQIQLLSPLEGVTEAELFIIVLDKPEQAGGVAQSFLRAMESSEQDFNAIGQAGFFETDEDNNVDWEDLFDVKPR